MFFNSCPWALKYISCNHLFLHLFFLKKMFALEKAQAFSDTYLLLSRPIPMSAAPRSFAAWRHKSAARKAKELPNATAAATDTPPETAAAPCDARELPMP